MVRRRRRAKKKFKLNFPKKHSKKIIFFLLLAVILWIAVQYIRRPQSVIHKHESKSKVQSQTVSKKIENPKNTKPVTPVTSKTKNVPLAPAVKTPPKAVSRPTVSYPSLPQPAVKYVPPVSPRRIQRGMPAITFVLDDVGHTKEYIDEFIKLGPDVTYAILPFLKYSRDFGYLSRQTGAEVILHLPFQSVADIIPGPGLITMNMPTDQIKEIVTRDLGSVPYHVGVNNHMGSRGTADPRVMRAVMGELKKRGLFFLDSFTTPKTVSFSIAKEYGIPILKRDIFLDNEDNQVAIRKQIRLAEEAARKTGYAIAIGHYRYNTIKVLQEEINRLRDSGFQIVSLSELLVLTGQKK